MQEVRDRVAAVQSQLPARRARRRRSRAGTTTTASRWSTLALLSPTRSARELSILGEHDVGKRLQRVEGVARVEINGLTEREVRIDLDPVRLRAYGVTPAEIATALREANADQPVGLLTDRMQDALLRVEGRVRDPQAIRRASWWRTATAWR